MTNRMDGQKILRILDANINRAMEGLRVTEEVARFLLEDKKLTSKIKSIRNMLKHSVLSISKIDLLKARKALSDVGGSTYTAGEKTRKNVYSIFKSNIKRTEEAIRVLEEFSKLSEPSLGKAFKKIRFALYDIEKKIILKLSR